MKKLYIIPVILMFFFNLILIGCGEKEEEKAVETAVEKVEKGPLHGPMAEPVYGGTLKIIVANGPQVLSYVPLMGPGDHSAIFPAGERLVDVNTNRSYGGIDYVLAENVVEDVENLKITWYIRKGIKFHDGSDLNAEVVAWNFQQIIDAKALPYIDLLKGMMVKDEYTLVFDLNEYSNQLVQSWGWWPVITSKEAWDKASGGDIEKGKEWARTHIVGTGPFVLKEYKRDDHMTWVKNPNYWRKGRPYLDGIEYRYIPDPVTARALFESGEADQWAAQAKDQKELLALGYKKQSDWPGLSWVIWINTAAEGSKWHDKRLREAVEYSLDKAAIANVVGFGQYKPLKSLPPEGEWGYEADYNPRPYNPEKAKQLLADAGYPNGLKAKLLIMNDPVTQEIGQILKQYLDKGGFQIDLDIADPGRFFGSVYGKTPSADADLHWWISGMDTNYLLTYMRWFSTMPFTNLAYLGHTDEQAQMDKKAQSLVDLKEQEKITKQVVRYLTDNALVIPVYISPAAVMLHPYVHSTQYTQGFIRWQTEEVWMEKH